MPDTVTVAIKKTDYYDPQIHELLMPFGGMRRFVSENEKVLLKVNLLSARGPEEAVTTHPEFIRAIARDVRKAGGVPYIGDSPAGGFSKKSLLKAYEKSGIMLMAKEEDIPLNFDTGSEKVVIPDGVRVKRIPVCNYLLKADKIIGIPKLKTHSFQYLTLACKNMYGAVPGYVKAKYHAFFPGKMAFADLLLDIYSFVNPHLFIMDAVLGMHGEGPAGNGDPIEIGLALASHNGIALDIAVCSLIGIEPAGIPLLKRAKIRNMWPENIEYPMLTPHENRIQGFRMPDTAIHLITGKSSHSKSPVITQKCIGCGECKRICPKNAVNIVDEIANIDYSKCIRCYCCQEICPANAVRLMNIK